MSNCDGIDAHKITRDICLAHVCTLKKAVCLQTNKEALTSLSMLVSHSFSRAVAKKISVFEPMMQPMIFIMAAHDD